MRGRLLHTLTLALTLALGAAATCRAHGAPATLVARRLSDAGTPKGQEPAWPAFAREAMAARDRAWRSFPDLVVAPGVNLSPLAARRRGWTPARAGLRNPHAAHAGRDADLSATPPDTIRVAILRIDFLADRGGGASTGNGRFDLTPPDTLAPPIDRPPHNRTFYLRHLESLARYYDVQTYGRVVITGDVWPREENLAYSVSDMADFGPWLFSQTIYRDAVTMFQTMIRAADSQSVALGDRVPWADVDRVVLLHAGSDLQSDLRQDSPSDIPSFTIGVADTDAVVLRDVPAPGESVLVDRASLIPETINQDGYYGTINGVLAHECGHLFFGFSDLYDVNSGLPRVGYWSLMDSGNLLGSIVRLANGDELYATGLLPPSLDPFQRFFASDVLEFPDVAYGATDTLPPSQRVPAMRRLWLSSDEYVLLENRYLAPAQFVELDQDSATRVILGPRSPDRFEWDALLPGGGMLAWHVDASVIPFEYSLRTNPEFGFNTNPFRYGVRLIEADGLADLGDLGSPFLLGSYRDPWYVGNNATLSDSTPFPRLVANSGTRPHARLDVLTGPDSIMVVRATRTWQLPGWPVGADFPPGGPQLLAVDADGQPGLEVCWAGGDSAGPDSASLFALRADGTGMAGGSAVFATLDRRPLPVMAALPTGAARDAPGGAAGPSLFAVTTVPGPSIAGSGGRVWLLDHQGVVQPGWPAGLPAPATTPPVFAAGGGAAAVLVGAANGQVYAIGLDGVVLASTARAGAAAVTGRLAVTRAEGLWHVAFGRADGSLDVVTTDLAPGNPAMPSRPGWPVVVHGGDGFAPDFLWLDFDGTGGGSNPSRCATGEPELVARHADRLWAFCGSGAPLAGWGRSLGDTLAAGLGAADADGDGFLEVLTQSWGAQVAFVNVTGAPSPGWPRRAGAEGRLVERGELTFPREPRVFPASAAPVAADVAAAGRPRIVTLSAGGLLTALDDAGRQPEGWPLATGAGAGGAPLIADLDGDGALEVVAPDRFGALYAYTLPGSVAGEARVPWAMLGGDPQRTSHMPASRTAAAPAPSAGPFVRGSLKAYPNPARRRPVTLAWRLTAPADVEIRVLDTSGHEVASFSHAGVQSDNIATWEPGAAPAGLYLVRLRFRGQGGEHVEVIPVGILR